MRSPSILTGIALCSACAGGSRAPTATKRIDRVISGLEPSLLIQGDPEVHWSLAERMTFHHVPAVSIAVIDSGRIEWALAVGLREAGGTDSIDTETVFEAGSISKPTFAVGAMRLVERGTLALDEDVNVKLRSWHVPANRFTDSAKVTLRRLLSHTAGLTVHGFPGYQAGTPLPSIVQVLDGVAPANTAPVRVDTVPGSIVRYSGGGTTVAMLLAMDATGRPFPELMRELVLDPAGMSRSSFEQPLPARLAPNAASGHLTSGAVVPGRYFTYPEMAAAGLWTTPSDLARLLIEVQRAYRGESTMLLGRPMAIAMLTPQGPPGEERFGIGFGVVGTGPDLEFSHGGADAGFRAEIVSFPERRQGAVVMTNGDDGETLIEEILASVAAEYGWPSRHPRKKMVVTKDSTELRQLVGVYALEVGAPKPLPATVTIEGGKLVLEVDASQIGKTELLADSDSTFFIRNGGISVVFRRDRTGRGVAVTIDRSITGPRVR